ncbi:MAG: hypothetical protein QOG78_2048 [Rhodospirillaceae bacterium]|jgi:hypothetical protein|nr:hypothetical protein [Rhodospirillaceae bacterium]
MKLSALTLSYGLTRCPMEPTARGPSAACGKPQQHDGEGFLLYAERVLGPLLSPGDIVIMDNLGSHRETRPCAPPSEPPAESKRCRRRESRAGGGRSFAG